MMHGVYKDKPLNAESFYKQLVQKVKTVRRLTVSENNGVFQLCRN